MALNLRASVDIRAPAAHIFDLVCTPERLPEWNLSIERAYRAEPGEPVCLGSRATFSGRLLGQVLETETEVVAFEPPRLFTTRAVRGPRLVTCFELDALPEGTRVEVNITGEVPGGALGAMVAEGFLRKELGASLERLRVLGELHVG
ncbi:MAG: SRPBCC family protein [Chloroflexi bacterium]|nr:SRPBCC family protein [Chloroflexota bacterium]